MHLQQQRVGTVSTTVMQQSVVQSRVSDVAKIVLR